MAYTTKQTLNKWVLIIQEENIPITVFKKFPKHSVVGRNYYENITISSLTLLETLPLQGLRNLQQPFVENSQKFS